VPETYLRAAGCVTVHGCSLEAIRGALGHLQTPPSVPAPASVAYGSRPRDAGWIEPLPRPERWIGKPARLGRMDRLSHLALCAAEAAAQSHGGLPDAGDRGALVLGTAFGAHLPNELFWRGVREAGSKGASPSLFAYTLPSAASGELAIHFGLRGPNLTLAQGRGSGVAALAAAAGLLEAGQARVVLAGAADSLGATLLAALEPGAPATDAGEPHRVPCEGAAFFLLASEPGASPLGRIAASAQASGDRARERAEQVACSRAGLVEAELRARIDRVHPAFGDALAPGPLFELALALEGGGPLPCLLTAVDREAGTADALCVVEAGR
jgi:hypothetical protein